MLTGIKMKDIYSSIAGLGQCDHLKMHVKPSKIYVNPGIKVHSNDFFSETTAPMILKFSMQHDKTTGP